MRLPSLTAVVLLLTLGAGCAAAEVARGDRPQPVDDRYVPHPAGVRVETWVEGLEVPWSLVFLPDGRALVSERPGRIRLIEDGRLRPEPFAEIEVNTGGEGGLMGLALHPDFPRQPYLYAMHTARGPGGRTNRVVRLRVADGGARLDRTIIEGIPGARYHDGGRIAFGPDGMLYVGTGDAGDPERAQDLDSLAGKILRLTPDGAVPPDNPFPGSPVFTLGHRNVQGLAWHPETGQGFASEHGPSGEFGLHAYDEVNALRPGGNYGWPRVVGAGASPRYIDPVVAWPDTTTPPAGMAFWRDALFVATLGSRALIRIELERAGEGWRATDIERWFRSRDDDRFGRLRDAVAGPDGALYVLTSNRDGRGRAREGDDRILRIVPQD